MHDTFLNMDNDGVACAQRHGRINGGSNVKLEPAPTSLCRRARRSILVGGGGAPPVKKSAAAWAQAFSFENASRAKMARAALSRWAIDGPNVSKLT